MVGEECADGCKLLVGREVALTNLVEHVPNGLAVLDARYELAVVVPDGIGACCPLFGWGRLLLVAELEGEAQLCRQLPVVPSVDLAVEAVAKAVGCNLQVDADVLVYVEVYHGTHACVVAESRVVVGHRHHVLVGVCIVVVPCAVESDTAYQVGIHGIVVLTSE